MKIKKIELLSDIVNIFQHLEIDFYSCKIWTVLHSTFNLKIYCYNAQLTLILFDFNYFLLMEKFDDSLNGPENISVKRYWIYTSEYKIQQYILILFESQVIWISYSTCLVTM